MNWPTRKARVVFAALMALGWRVKRHAGGSHAVLQREGWPDYVWSFADHEELGRRMLARIAKHTGLRPEDLGATSFPRAVVWECLKTL